MDKSKFQIRSENETMSQEMKNTKIELALQRIHEIETNQNVFAKVAMFNDKINKNQQSQLNGDGRLPSKPTFSKSEYGKPVPGSMTEQRAQKANRHVLKEMMELCEIIDSNGCSVKDVSPTRVILFEQLFNIYSEISDKVVGILLRARKHRLVEFEGEMLYQRRDEDVPIYLLKPIQAIRKEILEKIAALDLISETGDCDTVVN